MSMPNAALPWRVVAALLLVASHPAGTAAHQVDDYLAITHVEIARDRIELYLSLTPGSKLAGQVISAIDLDADGQLSAEEQQRYATGMMRNMALAVDDLRPTLRLTQITFPERSELMAGQGIIHLTIEAEISRQASGRHSLFVANNSADVTVYLVSALKPPASDLTILRQERDWYQRSLRIEYQVDWLSRAGLRAVWLTVGGLTIGGIGFRARRRIPVRSQAPETTSGQDPTRRNLES